MKPETVIQRSIQTWVNKNKGVISKTHGSQFSKYGESDLWGAVPADASGDWFIHFAVEVKDPDSNEPIETRAQAKRLEEWSKLGYAAGVVDSIPSFIKFLKWAWENGIGLSRSSEHLGEVWRYYEQG